jgi:hypothetical protein
MDGGGRHSAGTPPSAKPDKPDRADAHAKAMILEAAPMCMLFSGAKPSCGSVGAAYAGAAERQGRESLACSSRR